MKTWFGAGTVVSKRTDRLWRGLCENVIVGLKEILYRCCSSTGNSCYGSRHPYSGLGTVGFRIMASDVGFDQVEIGVAVI